MVYWSAPSSVVSGLLLVARSTQNESQEEWVEECCHQKVGDIPEEASVRIMRNDEKDDGVHEHNC